jgi:hypothetical protein
MNPNVIARRPFKRLIIVLALVYGLAVGVFVVPRVVGILVPQTVGTVRSSAYAISMRSSQSEVSPCHLASEGRRFVARLWNDFQ